MAYRFDTPSADTGPAGCSRGSRSPSFSTAMAAASNRPVFSRILLCPFLAFADAQPRLRAANRGIAQIIDRTRIYRVQLPIRPLRARCRNTRQNGCFLSVNRRVAASSPARGANSRRYQSLKKDIEQNQAPSGSPFPSRDCVTRSGTTGCTRSLGSETFLVNNSAPIRSQTPRGRVLALVRARYGYQYLIY